MDLRSVQTPFVVVDGIATALYMPQRLTLDLDILVLGEDAPRLHEELTRLGYRMERQLSIGGTAWRASDGGSLDVLESDELWVRAAVRTPNQAPTGELSLHTRIWC